MRRRERPDVLTERDTAWVDVVDEIEWLAKGTEFL